MERTILDSGYEITFEYHTGYSNHHSEVNDDEYISGGIEIIEVKEDDEILNKDEYSEYEIEKIIRKHL